MLLSAQRVRSPHGLTGINRYVYRHALPEWMAENLADLERSAVLATQDFEVPPGGNSVVSYLDIFAPEGTTSVTIAVTVARIRAGHAPSAFPAEFRKGDVTVRLGLVFGLVLTWKNELTDLCGRLLLSPEDSR
jgi:hypothetical protein